jgi:hypothetical protein
LISPITSPRLLRISISNLRDHVLFEKFMDLPESLPEVWFFVLRTAVLLFELSQSSFREFGPETRINEVRADFTSKPCANGLMREHGSLQPHEISASVEPLGRFGCAEVADLVTRRRIKDENLPCHLLPLQQFGGQCSLELLGWYARLGTLGPCHPWPTLAVDKNALFLRGPSCDFEQPDALGAILASRPLLRFRFGSRLRRLGLYFSLHFYGGPHFADSGLTIWFCGLLNDFGFLLSCSIFLFRHGFSSKHLVGAEVEP